MISHRARFATSREVQAWARAEYSHADWAIRRALRSTTGRTLARCMQIVRSAARVGVVLLCALAPARAEGVWSPASTECKQFTWTADDAGDAQPAITLGPGEIMLTAEIAGTTLVSLYRMPSGVSSADPSVTGELVASFATTNRSPIFAAVNGGQVIDLEVSAAGDGGSLMVCAAGYGGAGSISAEVGSGHAVAAAPASSPITVAITASRTSGLPPLLVHFETYSATDAGSFDSFHDMYCQWDFDDVGSGNHPAGDESSRNAELDSTIAAHVFEAAGTYDVVASCTDPDGNLDTDTTTITVSAWAGADTTCIATVLPVAGADGCPAGSSAYASPANDFDADVATNIGAGKRLLFRRGESYAHNAVTNIALAGPGMVGGYGSGSQVTLTGSGNVFRCNSAGTADDWRFVDFTAGDIGAGNAFVTASNGATHRCAHWLVKNVTGTGGSLWARAWNPVGAGNNYPNDVPGIVDTTWDGGGASAGNNTIYMPNTRMVIMGSTLSQPDPDIEHTIRVSITRGGYIGHNSVTCPNDTSRHCLKLHAGLHGSNPPNAPEASSFVSIVHNTFTALSTSAAIMVDIGPEDTDENWVDHVAVSGNLFVASSSTQKMIRLAITGYGWVRNSFFNMTGMTSGMTGIKWEQRSGNPTDIPDTLACTHNTGFDDDAGTTPTLCWFFASQTAAPRYGDNNLFVGDGTLTADTTESGEDSAQTGSTTIDSNDCASDPFATCPPVTFADWRIANGSAADDQGFADAVHASGDWEGDAHCATPDSGADEEAGC